MFLSSFAFMAYVYTMTFKPPDPLDTALPDPPPEDEGPLGDHEPDPAWDCLTYEEKLAYLDDELDNMYRRRGILGILGLKKNTHC